MLFNPRYGALGMLTMPYALISVLVPLVFMPLTLIVAINSLIHGEWQAIAIFSAFVAATHMIISIVAVLMVRENLLHLLMVPIYRLIYEPLRAYVVFGSAFGPAGHGGGLVQARAHQQRHPSPTQAPGSPPPRPWHGFNRAGAVTKLPGTAGWPRPVAGKRSFWPLRR